MNTQSGQGGAEASNTEGMVDAGISILESLLEQYSLDDDQFNEQLNMSDPSNQAYLAWCAEFARDKVRGASSVWDGNDSVYKFRDGVARWRGSMPWEEVIGNVDRAFNWRDPVSTATTGGGGGNTRRGEVPPFLMIWPWESGAIQAATWKHWAIWFALCGLIAWVALWVFGRSRKMYRKRRKAL